jgi:SAM-dependent methyltransferase
VSAWYEESFGKDYLIVYQHRDMQGAYQEVRRMVEWLKLPKRSLILDLCCGMGRHSLALSDFGYRVTGMDLSEVLLDEAKKLDKDGKVRWIRGDMRRIPLETEFDAVVNLFTSFGYFEQDEENGKVLKEVERVLLPGGKFIIDFLNPEYVREHLVPRSERQTGSLIIEEQRYIEDDTVNKRIFIREQGRPERVYNERVKLYSLRQFEQFIADAGLVIDRVYGNYDQSLYDEKQSPRMIITGHKGSETA